MVEQIDLVLREILIRDAKTAQRAEPGVDAVNGARLRGERFDELPAAQDQWTRLARQFAGSLQRGGLPDFGDGEVMSVQDDHVDVSRPWIPKPSRTHRQAFLSALG